MIGWIWLWKGGNIYLGRTVRDALHKIWIRNFGKGCVNSTMLTLLATDIQGGLENKNKVNVRMQVADNVHDMIRIK